MERIDRIIGWGIFAVGLTHSLLTPLLFPQLGAPAMWFLSGGIALMYLGAFNLLRVRYGRLAPGLRRVSVAANITLTMFACVYAITGLGARVLRSPSSLIFLALLIGATALSVAHAGSRDESTGAGTAGRGAGWRARTAGVLIMAIAVIHFLFGLFAYAGPLTRIARDGVWNAVDPYGDRQEAFWFLVFAVPLFFFGQMVSQSAARGQTVSPSLGWELLGLSLLGALLMPVSGFWLAIAPALLLLRHGAPGKRTAPPEVFQVPSSSGQMSPAPQGVGLAPQRRRAFPED